MTKDPAGDHATAQMTVDRKIAPEMKSKMSIPNATDAAGAQRLDKNVPEIAEISRAVHGLKMTVVATTIKTTIMDGEVIKTERTKTDELKSIRH